MYFDRKLTFIYLICNKIMAAILEYLCNIFSLAQEDYLRIIDMCIVIHLAGFQKCHLVNNLFNVLPYILTYRENISHMNLSTLFCHLCSTIVHVFLYSLDRS